MKISYKWLKDFVDLKGITPGEAAEKLTMSGSEVGIIRDVGGDKVMELEITSNRPDCLNILGIAREVSALFGKKLKLPDMGPDKRKTAAARKERDTAIICRIEAAYLCSYYTARVIKNIKVKPHDAVIKKRIETLGMRSVNNVVDITNYCLMELGQPLHAFDLDKIRGGEIIVRKAKKGEKMITIDGVERELDAGTLVIADGAGPIAIAGIMGGAATEVTPATKNILLESAYFDPASIRVTSRRLGIASDSSYRFERGVDKGMIDNASRRAAVLISKSAGGSNGGFYTAGKPGIRKVSINFDIAGSAAMLGVGLKRSEVKNALTGLGMTVTGGKGSNISVKVPSFRNDIRGEVDVTEEIARVLGYDRIPATIPRVSPAIDRFSLPRMVKEKVSRTLVSCGLNEIMTYSLISEASAKRFPDLVRRPVALLNPLSEEQKMLTPHLLDGMLKTISWNINRKSNDLMLFELGKTYSAGDVGKGYVERETLCVGMTGLARDNWMDGKREINLYDVKGIIEELLRVLNIAPEFTRGKIEGISSCACVAARGPTNDKKSSGRSGLPAQIGFIGEISEKALKEYGIDQAVFAAELSLDAVSGIADLTYEYHDIPRFPFSARDISILCDNSTTAGGIVEIIAGSGEELIRDVKLIDVYRGGNVPAGKKSLTYGIKYGLCTRTLKEEEVESVHSSIKAALVEKLGVTFR